MSKRKTTIILTFGGMIALAVLAALYSGGMPYSGSANAADIQEGEETVVDFSASFANNDLTLLKGETVIIPVDIYSAKEKAKELKVIVSEPEQPESIVETIKEAKTSEGIMVDVDKKSIQLEAQDDTGVAKRDSLQLTVSADENATEGMHTLAVTLVDEEDSFMTTYLRVNVKE